MSLNPLFSPAAASNKAVFRTPKDLYGAIALYTSSWPEAHFKQMTIGAAVARAHCALREGRSSFHPVFE